MLMVVNELADDLECEWHPPSAVGDTPPKRLRDGSSRFRSEALAEPRSAPKKAARTGPRRAADLPWRRSALPQTSWREFGEFRDNCGTALSCDMTACVPTLPNSQPRSGS